MNSPFRRIAATAALTAVPVVIALGTAAVSEAATGTSTSGSDNVATTAPEHVTPPSPMTPWQPRHHHRHHRDW